VIHGKAKEGSTVATEFQEDWVYLTVSSLVGTTVRLAVTFRSDKYLQRQKDDSPSPMPKG